MGDGEDVIVALNSMIEEVIKIDETKGDLDYNFGEFRNDVKLILNKLYDEHSNFMEDNSADNKFALALSRYLRTFESFEKLNAGDVHNVLSQLYKKLPRGGLASFFNHSVIKGLSAGFSKLVGKAKKFVKCFKARNKIIRQRKRKWVIFVKKAGKFLKNASQGKKLDDVRGDILDFIFCVHKICDDKFSDCVVESGARKIWEALRACSSGDMREMNDAHLVRLLDIFAKTVGNNRDFFDGRDVYKVVGNFESLIKGGDR